MESAEQQDGPEEVDEQDTAGGSRAAGRSSGSGLGVNRLRQTLLPVGKMQTRGSMQLRSSCSALLLLPFTMTATPASPDDLIMKEMDGVVRLRHCTPPMHPSLMYPCTCADSGAQRCRGSKGHSGVERRVRLGGARHCIHVRISLEDAHGNSIHAAARPRLAIPGLTRPLPLLPSWVDACLPSKQAGSRRAMTSTRCCPSESATRTSRTRRSRYTNFSRILPPSPTTVCCSACCIRGVLHGIACRDTLRA